MAVSARNIGLEAKKPSATCADSKCPWHGTLPVRGRVFDGFVKALSPKTAIVKWDFVRFVKKYERYERRHSSVVAYKPDCIEAGIGKKVRIAECRPISKTKSFVVIEVL